MRTIGGSGWSYGWGSQDDTESIDAIHPAIDLGMNWIDTAAVYGLGHSEEVVARAAAVDIVLTPEDLREIDEVAPRGVAAGARYLEAMMNLVRQGSQEIAP